MISSIYQMFNIIAQSSVGNLGNYGLIYVQLFLSLFFECKFLFTSMKKRPPLVQFSVLMIPLVLVATYAIACGIIFSSFLGNGPTVREMMELINLTLTEQCITVMLITAAVFFVLMLLYTIVNRLNPLEWLMTFGVEMLAAVSLFALYGGLWIENFPYTILDLCEKDIYLARWPIYGFFMLLFKCFVLVMCLILGFFLRERKPKQESEEEKYTDRRGYYERKTKRYFTKNDTLIGGATLLFSVAAEVFFVFTLRRETATDLDISTIFTVIFAAALFAMPGAFGVFLLHRALRPQTCVAYRQLLAMGNQDTVLRLFCEEVVDGKAPESNLWKSKTYIQTTHFLYCQQGIKTRVKWRGEPLQ